MPKMRKLLAIICNAPIHAEQFVIGPYNLKAVDCLIITPESTQKMHGRNNIEYVALRPLYAREKEIADTNSWRLVTKSELKARNND